MNTYRSNYWREMVFESELPAPIKLTAYAIASHVANETGRGYASQPRLMKVASCSERTVRSAVRTLEALELIHVTKSTGRGNAHTYQLTLPSGWPAERPADAEAREALIATLVKAASPAAFVETEKAASPAGQSGKAARGAGKAASPAGKAAPGAPLLLSTSSTSSFSAVAASTTTSVEGIPADEAALSIGEAWEALKANLDDMLESPSYAGREVAAYRDLVQEIDDHAEFFAELSPKAVSELHNRTVGHAVDRFYGRRADAEEAEGIEPSLRIKRPKYSRLYAARQTYGTAYVIAGIAKGLLADIKGDPTSFILAISDNLKKDAS